jgi:RNA recognition motif-containing protein
MILFVRNIPENAKTKDLKEFVEPALAPRFFFLPKRGRVLKAEIMALQNIHNKLIEHHGLVFLDSKPALHFALNNLRGKRFKNRPLQIREYKFRSKKNDRRRFANTNGMFEDQRLHDRRRGSSMQIIETLATMSLVT